MKPVHLRTSKRSTLWNILPHNRQGVLTPQEKKSWTLFSRFGRDGEEGQRWMPFSKLTRPRFGKRGMVKNHVMADDIDKPDF